jgi:hypothetical protein
MLPVDYEGARDVFLEYINKEGPPFSAWSPPNMRVVLHRVTAWVTKQNSNFPVHRAVLVSIKVEV